MSGVARSTADLQSVQKVQEILRTWRRVDLQRGDVKLMYFILMGAAADLEVASEALTIRYDWNPSRHRYFPNAAPGIVSKLLEWCGARVIVEPSAFRFSGTCLPRRGLFWARIEPSEAFDVWFFPETEARVMVRRATRDASLPRADTPPRPVRAERRVVTLAHPIACPHCGNFADSYRNLGSAWLCATCARSFPVGPTSVPR